MSISSPPPSTTLTPEESSILSTLSPISQHSSLDLSTPVHRKPKATHRTSKKILSLYEPDQFGLNSNLKFGKRICILVLSLRSSPNQSYLKLALDHLFPRSRLNAEPHLFHYNHTQICCTKSQITVDDKIHPIEILEANEQIISIEGDKIVLPKELEKVNGALIYCDFNNIKELKDLTKSFKLSTKISSLPKIIPIHHLKSFQKQFFQTKLVNFFSTIFHNHLLVLDANQPDLIDQMSKTMFQLIQMIIGPIAQLQNHDFPKESPQFLRSPTLKALKSIQTRKSSFGKQLSRIYSSQPVQSDDSIAHLSSLPPPQTSSLPAPPPPTITQASLFPDIIAPVTTVSSICSDPYAHLRLIGEDPNEEDSEVTIQSLVERLISTKLYRDVQFTNVFLLIYQKFLTSQELLDLLLLKFHSNEKKSKEKYEFSQHSRIVYILSLWLSDYPEDLLIQVHQQQKLEKFIDTYSKKPKFQFILSKLKKTYELMLPKFDRNSDLPSLIRTSQSSTNSTNSLDPTATPPISPISGKKTLMSKKSFPTVSSKILNRLSKLSLNQELEEFDSFEFVSNMMIAAQLTLLEFEYFKKIKSRDLLSYIWKQPKTSIGLHLTQFPPNHSHDTSPPPQRSTLTPSISHFNYISSWVSTKILSSEKPKNRAKVLSKFIHIAQELRNLNNYNSLMAVLAGINATPVHRLSHTFESLEENTLEILDHLNELMKTENSYSNYRKAFSESQIPTIPYIGICLGDLIFINEYFSDKLSEEDKIHWKKFEMLGNIILLFRRLQTASYRIEPDYRILDVVKNQKVLTEDELYEKSFKLEKRKPRFGDEL